MTFAGASAVRGGPGRWEGTIPEGWDIRGITNGGFIMAMATRAMEAESDGRELISATGTFVNPANGGPVEIVVEQLKSGRSLSTMTATVLRDDKSLVYVTGVYAHPDRPMPAEDLVLGDPPELPSPDDCIRATPAEEREFPPPLTGHVDMRVHPDDASALEEQPGDRPMIRGWFRLLDEEPIDGHGVVLATDCFPPAIFNSPYSAGWTPTIELAIQVREPRPSGWLACRFETRFVTGGMLEEDGQLWDEKGRLVALSRQLALVPR